MSKIDLTTFFITASLLFTMLGQGSSCGNKVEDINRVSSEKRERLATGMWGGEHISLEVTDGGGSLEFDCASGMIDRPIILDSEGKFDVAGKYVREHAGPVRRDEENYGRSARYTGRVKEKALTLTVTLKEPEETIGTFNLTQGSPGRVMKCR
jgi:hypothetical protein